MYIYETYHKYLYKDEIPWVIKRRKSYARLVEYLEEIKKFKICKWTMFKKIALMNGKGEFSKTKGSICNINV